MTTTIAQEVDRRARRRGPPPNMFARLADLCDELLDQLGPEGSEIRLRYREDPVGFARDVLGFVPCRTIDEIRAARAADPRCRVLWWKQIEILEALVAPRARMAVRSGHKISKSFTAAIAALWFYCCFDDARVVITAVTARQVDEIIWREIKKQYRASREPIAGKIGELARTGLKSVDQREIVGFTAREAEAVAGVSGANLLYLLDEASGIGEDIFEAIEGNRAGGARMCLFSNPTRTVGEFFEAFHQKKDFYTALVAVSSEENPNALTGEELIPGLAGRDWVNEKAREWGVDSALYKVRVKGEFVRNEEGRVVSLHMLEEAEERWASTEAEGRLHIGLDPAGPGEDGDETTIVPRRGFKVLDLVVFAGQDEDAILVRLLDVIRREKRPRDLPPVVVLDYNGPVGAKVARVLNAYLDGHPNTFELALVRPSNAAVREPDIYDRIRDELWACCAAWLLAGGAIPEDARLEKELHAAAWFQDIRGKLKVTRKEDLRKLLDGRSPDRADGVCLAVWDPVAFRPGDEQTTRSAQRATQRDELEDARVTMDPYEGGIDPYGGR